MAVIQKTLFAKNLDKYSVLANDTDPNSKYFKVTELPDTLTGGKNAFLIAGSDLLVADTKILIEIKSSDGKIIYNEPGEGYISSSLNGVPFVTEYYEGVSKVVSVYVYPDTSFGECTITILGEINQYEDGNGMLTPIPLDWEGKYNVKWQKTINVNPSLANTTKIRFYERPTANITEILAPIYRIVSGSKVDSGINQSFANIKLSKLETFAGDVKRVKVFRTSQGDISDYDLIQDILVESKELLTSYGLSGSVVGNTGIFTSETLKNYWNTGSLNVYLTSSRIESGIALNGSGLFTYTSSLDIKSTNTYELNLDAFYSSSISTNLGIYLISGLTGSSVATLNGTAPTKNLSNIVIPFKMDTDYPSASLYFSQSQGEWHLGNISLKLSQDTAFSPDEISFVTTMPTVIGNETYNFKFEFYDVNNNYVPVAVTQSTTFNGGNTNIGGTILLISSSASSSLANLNKVSSSISGTMTVYSSSASSSVGIVSGSVFNLSGSVSTSVQLLTGSISSSLSSSFGYASSSVYTLSGSVSSSQSALSASISRSVYNSLTQSFTYVQSLANGNYSGSFISGNIIYAPVIGGQLGYFSTLFKVGQSPNSIYLDARQTPRKIFIGGAIPSGETEYSGAYNNTNTNVYLDSSGKFSLGDKLNWNGTTLNITGNITIGSTQLTEANTLNTNTTATNVGLGNVENLTAKNQAQTGLIAGTTITGGGITLSGGGNIKGGQTDYNTGTGFFLGYSGAAYKFSIGNASSKGITWDGNALSIGGDVNIGVNLASTLSTGQALTDGLATKVSPADVANNIGGVSVTTITGDKIKTGLIESTNFDIVFSDLTYALAGTRINLNNGVINSKNFYISSTGDAFFKGNITGASGTFSGNLSGATISGGTISIGSNFSVSNTGIVTAAGVILSGNINATGGNIGGWVVDGTILRDANSRMKLNPTTPGLEIYDTIGNKKVDIKQGALSDPASSGQYLVGGNGVSIAWGPAGNLPNSGNPYVSSGYGILSISTAGSYKVAASPTWGINNGNFIAFSGGTIYGQTYASVYLAFCTTTTYSAANTVAVIQVGQSDVVNNGTYSTTKYFAMNVDNSQYTISLPATTLYVFTLLQFIGNVGASGGVFGINSTITPSSKNIVLQLNQIELTDEGMLVVAGANNYAKISRTTSSDMVVVKQDSTLYTAISAANAQGTGYPAIKTTAGDINSAGRLITLGFDSNIGSSGGYNNYQVKMYSGGPRMGELFLSTSTLKHKKDIVDWEKDNILDKIKLVNPKKFRYKTWDDTTELTLGLIAEDLRDNQLDEAALHNYNENNIKQNDVEGIDWEKISVILWKGVQELTQRIEQLENKISGSI